MNITTTIPSYAYWQYSDDPNIVAFFKAYNAFSQQNLDDINGYELPVYLNQTGALLSWCGANIYGVPRPNLSSGSPRPIGPLNTWALNTETLDGFSLVNDSKNYLADDLTYQRILQWNTLKDGEVDFTMGWLKRRISRFLHGDILPENTYDISVTFIGDHQVLISVSSTNLQQVGGAIFNVMGFNDINAGFNDVQTSNTGVHKPSPMASALKAAINSGVLSLPFQYKFTVQI